MYIVSIVKHIVGIVIYIVGLVTYIVGIVIYIVSIVLLLEQRSAQQSTQSNAINKLLCLIRRQQRMHKRLESVCVCVCVQSSSRGVYSRTNSIIFVRVAPEGR